VYHAWGPYKRLVGKPQGDRPLRGPGRRWEGNIKMDERCRLDSSGSG